MKNKCNICLCTTAGPLLEKMFQRTSYKYLAMNNHIITNCSVNWHLHKLIIMVTVLSIGECQRTKLWYVNSCCPLVSERFALECEIKTIHFSDMRFAAVKLFKRSVTKIKCPLYLENWYWHIMQSPKCLKVFLKCYKNITMSFIWSYFVKYAPWTHNPTVFSMMATYSCGLLIYLSHF